MRHLEITDYHTSCNKNTITLPWLCKFVCLDKRKLNTFGSAQVFIANKSMHLEGKWTSSADGRTSSYVPFVDGICLCWIFFSNSFIHGFFWDYFNSSVFAWKLQFFSLVTHGFSFSYISYKSRSKNLQIGMYSISIYTQLFKLEFC